MKKLIFIIFAAMSIGQSFAQEKYQANWESLESRKNPQWFQDAKFGIFIHWGLYSVPGYSNKGTYAEWYWNALMENPETASDGDSIRHLAVKAYHDKEYGENFSYTGFKDLFTCNQFDAKQWAGVFKQSGAKYVVLTSKHHDGYCLWPNKEASKSFGLPWNSLESGPKRDLVGELTKAVRAEGIKMGLYYSIWDWYNPYWTPEQQEILRSGTMTVDIHGADNSSKAKAANDIQQAKAGLSKYIHEVMYPQFKEIVMDYQPSLIFSDGDWWMDDELWETKPLLAWLFNNAPNKDEVVINDRWGKVRGEYGGYFTTEYGSGFDNIDKPWEENRGIGHSFGYNRIESLDDYKSSRELVYVLIDIVSRGGNLLLNIGPRADGLIPVIMQQRLKDIGNWLAVNGEAIYETKAFERTCQWSKGKRPNEERAEYGGQYDVMNLTVNAKEGMASKEILFTQKEDNLYCICPVYPKGKLVVKDVRLNAGAKLELLGYDKPLKWKKEGANIIIDVPALTASEVPCDFAWTFKLTRVKE